MIKKPNDSETAEYAAALTENGSLIEANELLDSINNSETPEVHLYRAFNLFTQWKYREAIPYLNKYIELMNRNKYQQAIGSINLVAAYINSNQLSYGEELINKLIETCKTNQFNVLLVNLYELMGQKNIFSNEFSIAEKNLSANILSSSSPI